MKPATNIEDIQRIGRALRSALNDAVEEHGENFLRAFSFKANMERDLMQRHNNDEANGG